MDKINELTKKQKMKKLIFIANVIDKARFANEKNRFQYMHFFDLTEQKLIKRTLDSQKVKYYELFGGYEQAERKILLIYPGKIMENIKDIENYKKEKHNETVCILRIDLPKEQYGEYEHRNYLGALMKLGVKREKIGDIVVRNDGADIIISTDIEGFLKNNINYFTRFKKSKIQIVPIEELKYVEPKKEIIKINVSSMRLDCIVAELARCSRNEANKLIEEERVFVNFEEELVSSKKIEENTYITSRGKGRFKVLEISGETKSGRLNLLIEK